MPVASCAKLRGRYLPLWRTFIAAARCCPLHVVACAAAGSDASQASSVAAQLSSPAALQTLLSGNLMAAYQPISVQSVSACASNASGTCTTPAAASGSSGIDIVKIAVGAGAGAGGLAVIIAGVVAYRKGVCRGKDAVVPRADRPGLAVVSHGSGPPGSAASAGAGAPIVSTSSSESVHSGVTGPQDTFAAPWPAYLPPLQPEPLTAPQHAPQYPPAQHALAPAAPAAAPAVIAFQTYLPPAAQPRGARQLPPLQGARAVPGDSAAGASRQRLPGSGQQPPAAGGLLPRGAVAMGYPVPVWQPGAAAAPQPVAAAAAAAASLGERPATPGDYAPSAPPLPTI